MIKRLLKYSVGAAKRAYKTKSPLLEVPCVDDKNFLFIVGLHRSGTSILHRLLREHPSTSGFTDTGVREDEGQHLQSIFPSAHKHGGSGSFSFDPQAHLTEESALVNDENKSILLREWGAYYDLNKKVLLEKSPPNIVRSRFFQALLPQSRFVFIVRHPISVALATRKWSGATITELLLHWHVAHSIMLKDLEKLPNYVLLRYEDFIVSPQHYLDKICDLMNIEHYTAKEKLIDHNKKYFEIWQQEYVDYSEFIETLFPLRQSPMEYFGYSFTEPYVLKSELNRSQS